VRLIIEAAARTDIAEAALWYNEQEAGLGVVFLDTVHARLQRIASNPRIFSLRRSEVRGAGLKKFPYTIYFKQTGDLIQIIAMLHQSRDLSALDERLN
jgi:plasmid stabilization system protein ParE